MGDDDPVFILRDDAGKVAIFLALRVVVRFDDCAHSAELIFELVDAFWIIMPLRRVMILSRTPMGVLYALEVFDASAIVRRLWGLVGCPFWLIDTASWLLIGAGRRMINNC